MEGPGVRVHRGQRRDHPQAVGPHHLRQGGGGGGQARAAKEVTLKDPKDWKIAGKPLKRLDTADKVTGKQVYSMDVKLPGMLNAAIKESPVFGGKVKLRRRQGCRHARREEGGAERRCRRCGHRRYLVAGQDRARGAADRLGRRRERQGLQRIHRRNAQGRSRRRGVCRPRTGDAKDRSPRRPRRSRRSTPIRTRTTPHGADERDRRYHPGQVRGVVERRTAKPRLRQPRKPPDSRPKSATSTIPSSAAASVVGRGANM